MNISKTKRATDIGRDIQFTTCVLILFVKFIFISLFSNKSYFDGVRFFEVFYAFGTKKKAFPIGFCREFQFVSVLARCPLHT